jgi:hypothetical protein
VRSYGSFVLRCWSLEGGVARIRLEHIQSGESIQVTSLAAAMDWINKRHPRRSAADPGEPGPELLDGPAQEP